MLTPPSSSSSATAALFAAVLLLTGCGSDPAPAASEQAGADPKASEQAGGDQQGGAAELSAGNERACDQAREVTRDYATALQGATTAAQARVVVDDAVTGLRDIDGEPPVDGRVDAVADALSALLTAVEEQRQPEELRPVAERIGAATQALAADCGLEPGVDPEQDER